MITKGKVFRRISVKARNKMSKQSGPKLYSPREKLQNCIWIFTIGDADDNPSVPHAHAKERGYRLDAWTGDIYPAGTERDKAIGKLTSRELKKLHSDSKFINFAKKQIEWYRSEYPHISFFVPEWFELKHMQSRLAGIYKEDEIKTFVFLGKAIIQK